MGEEAMVVKEERELPEGFAVEWLRDSALRSAVVRVSRGDRVVEVSFPDDEGQAPTVIYQDRVVNLSVVADG